MDEEDFYQEESFQDGQPAVQSREAERRRILADLRSLVGGEVSISQIPPVDPVLPHHLSEFIQSPRDSPGRRRPLRAGSAPQGVEHTPHRLLPSPSRSCAGHQRSTRTLRADPVRGSSQTRLAFNQPSNSIRVANSASPAVSPRNEFFEGGRVIPPPVREHPAEEVPWLSRQRGEAMFEKIDLLVEMVYKDREDWRYQEQRDLAYSRRGFPEDLVHPGPSGFLPHGNHGRRDSFGRTYDSPLSSERAHPRFAVRREREPQADIL